MEVCDFEGILNLNSGFRRYDSLNFEGWYSNGFCAVIYLKCRKSADKNVKFKNFLQIIIFLLTNFSLNFKKEKKKLENFNAKKCV